MQILLRDVLNEIDNVDLSSVSPDLGEVEENEEVLGILPDDLKKLFVVRESYYNFVGEECKRIHSLKKVDQKTLLLLERHELLHEFFELLSGLFWNSVRGCFEGSTLKGSGIVIRKGWKVVSLPEKEDKARLSIMMIGAIPRG
ncbi:MAG: hypothetical protein PHQ08_01360 [Candidatus Pacebacteria bacterium]|nr:hypothetical protein [Candidatus Paceibacterota bacterium]